MILVVISEELRR